MKIEEVNQVITQGYLQWFYSLSKAFLFFSQLQVSILGPIFSPSLSSDNNMRGRSPSPHPLPSHVLPQKGMSHLACSQRAASFFPLKSREQRQTALVASNCQFDSKANKILADHRLNGFCCVFVLSACGPILGLKWFSRWQGRWGEEWCHHYRSQLCGVMGWHGYRGLRGKFQCCQLSRWRCQGRGGDGWLETSVIEDFGWRSLSPRQ